MTAVPTAGSRRSYDSPLRRERAGQTRSRIVAAGAELLQGSSIRDWQGLTIGAVAERAGVSARTVFRHFGNERALRDAVMGRLEKDAGIDLAQMRLSDIADVTARIFRHVSAYPLEPRSPLDPTLLETNRRQHDALLAAVEESTQTWGAADRTAAAAMFDVLWSVGAYERLITDWRLDSDEAIRAITWVVGLVEEAIRAGRRPQGSVSRTRAPRAS